MALMAQGKIPNTLLTEATKLFNGKNDLANKVTTKDDGESLTQLGQMVEFLTEACLVNPTYKQLKEINLELTLDMQLSILMYSQGGIEALKGFRDKQKHNEDNQSSTEI